jgi:hypothetical protein
MAIVTVENPEELKVDVESLSIGEFFYGQTTRQPHIRTITGSVHLNTGRAFTLERLKEFGPVEAIPEGSTIQIHV